MRIEGKVGGMEQHLKNLNGRTDKNEIKGEENEDKINKIKNRMSYYMGGGAALFVVFGFVFTLVIKFKYGG